MDHLNLAIKIKCKDAYDSDERKRELSTIALKMFEDGMPYKMIKRYTGIDLSYC